MTPNNQYTAMRVLVAEDNAINQRLIGAMLQSIGINPSIVDDGAAALAEVQRRPYDLILTDMDMPVMDGLTAIEQIRRFEMSEQRMRTPVYVISARYDECDLRALVEAGADGVVPKPIRVPLLLNAVLDGVKRWKARAARPWDASESAPSARPDTLCDPY